MPAAIKDDIRQFYTELFLEPKNRNKPVEQVHGLASRLLRDQGRQSDIPGPSWVFDFKKQLAERLKELPWLDQPWSIGSMANPEFGQFTGLLPTFIDLSRMNIGVGSELTNRQALWAARLLPYLENTFQKGENRTQRLWITMAWANRYAAEEIASEVLEKPASTTGLDQTLVFSWAARSKAERSAGDVSVAAGRRLNWLPEPEPSLSLLDVEIPGRVLNLLADEDDVALLELQEFGVYAGTAGGELVTEVSPEHRTAVDLAIAWAGKSDPTWMALSDDAKKDWVQRLSAAMLAGETNEAMKMAGLE